MIRRLTVTHRVGAVLEKDGLGHVIILEPRLLLRLLRLERVRVYFAPDFNGTLGRYTEVADPGVLARLATAESSHEAMAIIRAAARPT